MRKVIVTGASSGIGRAIAEKLAAAGYEVYGIGRAFKEADNAAVGNNNDSITDNAVAVMDNNGGGQRFHKVILDLLDTSALEKLIREINKDEEVCILVNNAGVGYYGLHEQLDIRDIQTMVRTNLEVPLLLSNMLLRSIKKNNGFIVNISSHTATQANPHGCAYGATKAGISSFSRSLFEEERRYGLKVVNIEPDMTDTNLYRSSNFGVDEDERAFLSPEEVANAVMFAISQREGCVAANISLRPQLNRIKHNK